MRYLLKGTENDIQQFNFLFADLDPKRKLNDDDSYSYEKIKLLEKINQFPIPPTILVDSENGYHIYWKLDSPTTNVYAVKYTLSTIQKRLGSDPRAMLATQLLKVPYTHNRKNVQARLVHIIAKNQNKYTLNGFMKKLNISDKTIKTISKSHAQPKSCDRKIYENGIKFNFNKKPNPLNITVNNYQDLITI